MPVPRVVFLGHVARTSGGEIALRELIADLGDRIHAEVLLGEDGPLVAALEADGVSVRIVPMSPDVRDTRRSAALSFQTIGNGPALAGYEARLARTVRQLRPDILHTNTLKAALLGGVVGRLLRVPVVWHIRDLIAEPYLDRRTTQLVHAAARVLPTAVVTNSVLTAEALPRLRRPPLVVRERVRVPGSDRPRRPRPGTAIAVGMAGRLAPWKGQLLFLEAFAEAFPAGPDKAVIIGAATFGETDYDDELRAHARRLRIADRVEFRGARDDMAAEYARLDLLVHYSVTPEPFGRVVAEGMAAGLCVLAADEGGPREIVTDGVDGVLVPPRDPHALAGALRRWAADPAGRRELGARAARDAGRDDGRSAASVDRLVALYHDLCRPSRYAP